MSIEQTRKFRRRDLSPPQLPRRCDSGLVRLPSVVFSLICSGLKLCEFMAAALTCNQLMAHLRIVASWPRCLSIRIPDNPKCLTDSKAAAHYDQLQVVTIRHTLECARPTSVYLMCGTPVQLRVLLNMPTIERLVIHWVAWLWDDAIFHALSKLPRLIGLQIDVDNCTMETTKLSLPSTLQSLSIGGQIQEVVVDAKFCSYIIDRLVNLRTCKVRVGLLEFNRLVLSTQLVHLNARIPCESHGIEPRTVWPHEYPNHIQLHSCIPHIARLLWTTCQVSEMSLSVCQCISNFESNIWFMKSEAKSPNPCMCKLEINADHISVAEILRGVARVWRHRFPNLAFLRICCCEDPSVDKTPVNADLFRVIVDIIQQHPRRDKPFILDLSRCEYNNTACTDYLKPDNIRAESKHVLVISQHSWTALPAEALASLTHLCVCIVK